MKIGITLPIAAVIAALTQVACGNRDREVIESTAAPTTSRATAPTPRSGPAMDRTGTSVLPAMAVSDREFVTSAASSDVMEVEASRLAVDRTQSDAVRRFAQQMLDDHTKTSQLLASIAREAGLTEPMQMNPAHSGDLDRLRSLGGRDFDREYAAQVGVATHQQAITAFERAARDATNPQLKSFAEQMLPHLRDHLRQAQALARQVGVPSGRLKLANAAGVAESSSEGASGPGAAAR
jgi:putative membrane protein